MLRLLSLLSAYRNLIAFLLLEVIAFFLIVRQNDYQRHRFGDNLLEVSGWVHEWQSGINQYFHLGADNAQLMDENVALRQELIEAEKQINLYRGLLGKDSVRSYDSLISPEKFDFLPCRVIRNSTDKNYNYITLDKGAQDGVETGMGVVSPQGVVGVVIGRSAHYAQVLSAINVSFSLLVKAIPPANQAPVNTALISGSALSQTQSDGHVGVCEWDGEDTYSARLTFIPETVPLSVGYEVITSGYRSIFPAGFRVGEISHLGKSKDGYHDARIRLATDFHALGNVYLIRAPHKTVLDSLEQRLPGE